MKLSGYNIMRDDSALLEEHDNSPPSFSVHLYPDHWSLNNGPAFSYTNPVSTILDDIRAFRIPTDFIQVFDSTGVPYYNGCLIVELLDYRPAKLREPLLETPDKQRVVLRPNGETLWADICTLNAKAGLKWSDMDALQIESKLLLATSAPLCLDPDPSLTRIVNNILRVSTPNIPNSLKRKAAAMTDVEEDETEKAKRAKIMQFMNPQVSPSRKPFVPSHQILQFKEVLAAAGEQSSRPVSNAPAPTNVPSGTLALRSILIQQKKDKTKSNSVPVLHLTTSYSQPTSSQPAPPAPAAQIPPSVPTQMPDDAARSASPSKQQVANDAVPQRPPSGPTAAPQANAPKQPPQATPLPFNPPLPAPDFLNPSAPVNKRRPSAAVRPITPAVSDTAQAAQLVASNQDQAQQQQQQVLPQTQAQPQSQPSSQPQQAQHIAPQLMMMQQQTRPVAITPNMSSLQAMSQFRNMAQFYQQNPGSMQIPQAAQAAVLAAAVHRQNVNGRQTPVNRVASSASPAPSAGIAHSSPMLPPAAAAAVMSRQNTPVTTNAQAATRGSPLVVGKPVAGAQQQPQQPIPGAHPIMMQPGTPLNPALAHYYQQQQRMAILRAQQQQAQMHQQGHMTPAPQQQQQNQQPGTSRPQQAAQEQIAGSQQPYSGVQGVQMPPQTFNYMQNYTQHPQYMWQQRAAAMGRGMGQMPPNGQQQIPVVPPGMTMQQMQALGRGGGLPNR